MPELPEVETVVQTLKTKLLDKLLLTILAISPSSVILLEDFTSFKVESIFRRGKYIILSGNNCLVTIHLRMTGRLLEKPRHPKFVRAKLVFDNVTVHFEDIRKFGRIVFGRNRKLADFPGIKILGLEPWDIDLEKHLNKKLKAARTTIKSFLLNQKNIAGIGNIYADEICFHAKISPFKPANTLHAKEKKALIESIHFILEKAIKLRGTSFAHFVDADGKKGNNFEHLQVYGRKGKNCFDCKQSLISQKIQGRSTVYCPHCQPCK